MKFCALYWHVHNGWTGADLPTEELYQKMDFVLKLLRSIEKKDHG